MFLKSGSKALSTSLSKLSEYASSSSRYIKSVYDCKDHHRTDAKLVSASITFIISIGEKSILHLRIDFYCFLQLCFHGVTKEHISRQVVQVRHPITPLLFNCF